ncbi:hypothetical protein CC2G_004091 [Coprinopsis cinerea AmutBmut pab1-1]|nr:hypothetical protein CC2G_004091 [Coprinopsis cinerea AmutBmut pab1-1]
MSSSSASEELDAHRSFFWGRRVDGVYDRMCTAIEGLGKSFAGAAVFLADFVRSRSSWSRNQSYNSRTGGERTFNFIGQITHAGLGTALGAAGSFNFDSAGPDGIPPVIDDGTRIKWRIVLASPTHATTRLEAHFNNQIAMLHDVRAYDEEEEANSKSDPMVYEWTKTSQPDVDIPDDLIIVNMGPVYSVPAARAASKSTAVRPKKRLRRVDVDNPVAEPASSNEPESPTTSTIPPPASATSPNGDEIRVGALYDPSLLPDYGGPRFALTAARLNQPDVRDVAGDIVPPWLFWDKLRPGTVVLINATLHCYVMPAASSGRNSRRDRKFYQINAKSVKVIAESNVDASPPRALLVAGNTQERSAPSAETVDALSAYANFSITETSPPAALDSPATSPTPARASDADSSSPHDTSSVPNGANTATSAAASSTVADPGPSRAASDRTKSASLKRRKGKAPAADEEGMNVD